MSGGQGRPLDGETAALEPEDVRIPHIGELRIQGCRGGYETVLPPDREAFDGAREHHRGRPALFAAARVGGDGHTAVVGHDARPAAERIGTAGLRRERDGFFLPMDQVR